MNTKQTEALKLALEVLESCSEGDYSTYHVIHPSFDVDAVNKAIEAIDEALAEQPAQQEPVAWTERELKLIDGMIEVQVIHAERCDSIPNRAMAEKQKGWDMERVELLRKIRTTTPPQRKPWVGLTDDEQDECVDIADEAHINKPLIFWSEHHYDAIEAKLREKNA